MLRTLCMFFLLLCLSAPAQARTLTVVSLESPPYAFRLGDEITGMLCEVVREGLRRMDLDVRFELVPWTRAMQMVRFGDADAVFYVIPTPERSAFLHFSREPLVTEATIALRKKGGGAAVDREFSNARIISLGVGRGFYYGPRLEGLLATRPFKKKEAAPGYEINLRKLLGGRIDIMLADRGPAAYFLRKKGMFDDVEPVTDASGKVIIFDSVKSYLAFSRQTTDPDMAEEFGEKLVEMRRDGAFAAIEGKYTDKGD